MSLMYIWPIKCIAVEGGVVCAFDLEDTDIGNIVDIKVIYVDEEWVVAIQNKYCIPVSVLKIDTRKECILYLAGSPAENVEAIIFGEISLDIRVLTKISLIIEMETPSIQAGT